jgi:hypothetical protein
MVFVKGQSGNPGGRPKKDWTWAKLLERVGEEIEPKSGKKFKELVSRRLWLECVNGNLIAIKELFNRMDGMPMQKLGGDPDSPIIVKFHQSLKANDK